MYEQKIMECAKSLSNDELYQLIVYMRYLVRENAEVKKNDK